MANNTDSSKYDKIRFRMNRKIVLGGLALLSCVILIAVCSFVPFSIDPSRWMTTEFLTDELMIVAIVIFSMVATMFIGQASNAQNELSNLAKARSSFFESVKRVTNISAFGQWVRNVMQPNDIRNMQNRIMRHAGIENFAVLQLEYAEIRALLETPQKYDGKYYKGLSREQIDTLIDIKNGKYKVELVEPEYYLSVKNLIDPKTITERSSKEGLKKGMFLTKSIMARVTLTVTTAMIFASLMRDLSSDMDGAAAALKFISRIWALVSSAFMGYMVGCQINDIDAEYIEMRVYVHQMFLQDKDFVPKSDQELAKEAYAERVRKENLMLPMKDEKGGEEHGGNEPGNDSGDEPGNEGRPDPVD